MTGLTVLAVLAPQAPARMACSGAAEEIEARFLRQLEGVTRFGFRTGKLVLTTTDDGLGGVI